MAEPVEVLPDELRTLAAGLEMLPELLDGMAVPLPLPGRDALAAEEVLPLLRTVVAGLATRVTPLLPEAAVVLLAVVAAVLRVGVPFALTALAEPRTPAVLLTAVPADDDLVTEELRTADEPLAPETDERELEASPPPMPLDP